MSLPVTHMVAVGLVLSECPEAATRHLDSDSRGWRRTECETLPLRVATRNGIDGSDGVLLILAVSWLGAIYSELCVLR
jgi:hypothetical protein